MHWRRNLSFRVQTQLQTKKFRPWIQTPQRRVGEESQLELLDTPQCTIFDWYPLGPYTHTGTTVQGITFKKIQKNCLFATNFNLCDDDDAISLKRPQAQGTRVYRCTCTLMYTYMYTYVHIHVHLCTHTCTLMYTYTYQHAL